MLNRDVFFFTFNNERKLVAYLILLFICLFAVNLVYVIGISYIIRLIFNVNYGFLDKLWFDNMLVLLVLIPFIYEKSFDVMKYYAILGSLFMVLLCFGKLVCDVFVW